MLGKTHGRKVGQGQFCYIRDQGNSVLNFSNKEGKLFGMVQYLVITLTFIFGAGDKIASWEM